MCSSIAKREGNESSPGKAPPGRPGLCQDGQGISGNPITGPGRVAVRFWVGVTDPHWFGFLKEHPFDEANFWQPNPTPPITNLPVGTPFFFKLRRPYRYIAGGGFWIGYLHLPLSLAWEILGEKMVPLATTNSKPGFARSTEQASEIPKSDAHSSPTRFSGILTTGWKIPQDGNLPSCAEKCTIVMSRMAVVSSTTCRGGFRPGQLHRIPPR